jgi:hypothetical protein
LQPTELAELLNDMTVGQWIGLLNSHRWRTSSAASTGTSRLTCSGRRTTLDGV